MKHSSCLASQKLSSLKPILCLLTLLFFSTSTLLIAADHEQHGSEDSNHHEDHELNFSVADLKEFSIKLAQAGPGVIKKTLGLTGEVIVEPERLYHVVPRCTSCTWYCAPSLQTFRRYSKIR